MLLLLQRLALLGLLDLGGHLLLAHAQRVEALLHARDLLLLDLQGRRGASLEAAAAASGGSQRRRAAASGGERRREAAALSAPPCARGSPPPPPRSRSPSPSSPRLALRGAAAGWRVVSGARSAQQQQRRRRRLAPSPSWMALSWSFCNWLWELDVCDTYALNSGVNLAICAAGGGRRVSVAALQRARRAGCGSALRHTFAWMRSMQPPTFGSISFAWLVVAGIVCIGKGGQWQRSGAIERARRSAPRGASCRRVPAAGRPAAAWCTATTDMVRSGRLVKDAPEQSGAAAARDCTFRAVVLQRRIAMLREMAHLKDARQRCGGEEQHTARHTEARAPTLSPTWRSASWRGEATEGKGWRRSAPVCSRRGARRGLQRGR